MAYYCPLADGRGNQLALSKIQYKHLQQLRDIEEGYKVEYKSSWDTALREKHLARVITSFANTEGGWLFIGVNDDGSISNVDKPRTDYGQQIAQILKAKVSPYPRYEARFVKNPDDRSKGVLIVYIYEGLETPYICQGTVYVRIGSSKEPVPASNRAEIDSLVAKRNKYLEDMEKFCVNEIISKDSKEPYCTIYLYNAMHFQSDAYNIWVNKERAESFSKENHFESWMITTESIMFFNSAKTSLNSQTNVLELYLDGSIKIYMPLTKIPTQLHESVTKSLAEKRGDINLSGFIGLDGFFVHSSAYSMLEIAIEYLRKNDLERYRIRIDMQNLKNSYIYFFTEQDLWINCMCERFRYCSKESIQSQILPIDDNKDMDIEIEYTIAFGIFAAFGMVTEEFLRFDNSNRKLIRKIIGTGGFNNIEYYYKVFGISI